MSIFKRANFGAAGHPLAGLIVSLVLLFAFIVSACGQAPQSDSKVTAVTFSSKVLGEDRRILIRTPPGYETNENHYPVLYITDGDSYLGHTSNSVEFLARNGRISELIIVAITHSDRTHDLTPTRVEAESPTSGGADSLLRFIADELIPHIERNYRTRPYRILAGHSFGGLFAVHAMLTKPDLFNAYIAAAPSMRWDSELLVRRAADFFKDRKQFNVTLFLTLSGGERREAFPAFDHFLTVLNSSDVKDFEWSAQRFPDEDHGSVVMLSYYYGLRKIFAGWQGPTPLQTEKPAEDLMIYENHYRRLSQRFGYAIFVPEQLTNSVAYRLLQAGKTEDAITAFKANVNRFPASANASDSLGEAYENSGRLDLAVLFFEKARALGQQNKDANATLFKEHLERAREKLKRSEIKTRP